MPLVYFTEIVSTFRQVMIIFIDVSYHIVSQSLSSLVCFHINI